MQSTVTNFRYYARYVLEVNLALGLTERSGTRTTYELVNCYTALYSIIQRHSANASAPFHYRASTAQ